MQGKLTHTSGSSLRVHTYTAPEQGWCVNSHIIELAHELVVIDAQYTLPFASEVVSVASTLQKPLSRLYLTHYHPDHILGAASFDAPIYALDPVAYKIEAAGDRVAREEHEKLGDAIPAKAERPSAIVAPGEETIDGVRFEFLELLHAETEHALMIGLPDEKILITQDLLYDLVHVFVGEKAFDSWKRQLDHVSSLAFERYLPGHGDPGGKDLFAGMKNYLDAAERAYETASTGEAFKQYMLTAFPEFRGRILLEHELRFLFPKKRTNG
jgi:glyoxylase-like metal-dependent hydrolase (beta-lactamase superfamily II)